MTDRQYPILVLWAPFEVQNPKKVLYLLGNSWYATDIVYRLQTSCDEEQSQMKMNTYMFSWQCLLLCRAIFGYYVSQLVERHVAKQMSPNSYTALDKHVVVMN